MLGYYLFQDKLSFMSFVGFVLIIGGIVVLSLNTQVHA
jgi:multidrug transporter EmrE-like cation transporter